MILDSGFEPFPFLSSAYAQTIIGGFCWAGIAPPSEPLIITLEDKDQLCCEQSTPTSWNPSSPTIVLVHGLTGSHRSNYMIRLSRKCYRKGGKVIRVNMRGCGSGKGLAKNPYHAGRSQDVLKVLEFLKQQNPLSPIHLLGFSLGGNIVLKLAGELSEKANSLLQQTIAVCPSIDLHESLSLMSLPKNRLFHDYYLQRLHQFAETWIGKKRYATLFEFDNHATAPLSGFLNALDYYKKCSSKYLLPEICHPCHILFAEDDPLINFRTVFENPLPSSVQIALSKQGGHMGFLGKKRFFWLDNYLLNLLHL